LETKIILRDDDVSANTNKTALLEMYAIFRRRFSDTEFWYATSPLSKKITETFAPNSVYPDPPFKHRERSFFYDVDNLGSIVTNLDGQVAVYFSGRYLKLDNSKVVSHGLLHMDHSQLDRDAQEMSIITSCRLLDTDTFVPPFNKFNGTTKEICDDHGIQLIEYEGGWKSLEFNDFNPDHKLWYYHSWRWTPETFKEKIDGRS